MEDLVSYKTRRQRLRIYEQALKGVQAEMNLPDRREVGLCKIMATLGVNVYNSSVIDRPFETKLPELYAQKPKDVYKKDPRYWWKPGKWSKRIDALEHAIALTKYEMIKDETTLVILN